ncbi:MAG TPA: DUF2267 domain-containing protein [Solirubrobacteraceae bacterium]|jgi:uncharacterized protein (DUF2267 family)
MREETFLQVVEREAGITRDEARKAARATLRTLGQRITRGEARDIAAFLTGDLREILMSASERAERFGLDQFVRRVAELEGVDEATAYRHVQAVFVALGEAVAPGELRDMAAQLPKEFDPLLAAARSGGQSVRQDPLVMSVAQLVSLAPVQARRAVEAVLETLAVRISDGEVEDLMERLPAALRPSLEHGLSQSRRATRMSLDQFLDRVAKLEGVSREEAERHARAVFVTLRKLVPNKEIYDLESELPRDYASLFSGVI